MARICDRCKKEKVSLYTYPDFDLCPECNDEFVKEEASKEKTIKAERERKDKERLADFVKTKPKKPK